MFYDEEMDKERKVKTDMKLGKKTIVFTKNRYGHYVTGVEEGGKIPEELQSSFTSLKNAKDYTKKFLSTYKTRKEKDKERENATKSRSKNSN